MSENAVEQVASAEFPTRWGKFRIYGFRGHSEGKVDRRIEEAVALVMGDVKSRPPLVRVHSQCLTGDVFHSLRCDCRQQLELSLSMISEEGAGILIYEQQEGRGIGLMAKLPKSSGRHKGALALQQSRQGRSPGKLRRPRR